MNNHRLKPVLIDTSNGPAAAATSPRRPSGIFAQLVLIISTLLIVYPLSIGPAIYVEKRCNNPTIERAIEMIYSPVVYFYAVCYSSENLFVRYVDFWDHM